MTATPEQVEHYRNLASEAEGEQFVRSVLRESRKVSGATSYVARCGRAATHGGHMFAGGMCVGNKSERIVEVAP